MSADNNCSCLELDRLRFIIENLDQPVHAVDADCRIFVFNRAAEEILGLQADCVIGRSLYDVFPNAPPEGYILPRVLKGEELRDFKYTDSLSMNKILKANAKPIVNRSGEIIGAVNIFQDITELIRLQEKSNALDQLLEQQHFVLNAMHNQLVILDHDGIIKVWNKAMEKLSGIRARDVVGTPMSALVDKWLVKVTPTLDSLRQGKDLKNRKTHLTINGQVHEMAVNTKVLRNHQNELLGVLAIYTDITEFSKQQEIIAQNERLASISQLAAGMAHEIRNPLTSVKGFIQILQNNLNTHVRHKKYFDIIIEELNRTNKLISDFLLLANPAEIEKAKEPLDMITLVKDTVAQFIPQARQQGVEIIVHNPVAEVLVRGDKEELKQVLTNIMKNALEAIQGKGTVAVTATTDRGKAILSVKDTGMGIDEADQAKIFDLLFSTKEMGTGLGLSLSKQIVNRHGGHIEVISSPGKGSTFKIILPTA